MVVLLWSCGVVVVVLWRCCKVWKGHVCCVQYFVGLLRCCCSFVVVLSVCGFAVILLWSCGGVAVVVCWCCGGVVLVLKGMESWICGAEVFCCFPL